MFLAFLSLLLFELWFVLGRASEGIPGSHLFGLDLSPLQAALPVVLPVFSPHVIHPVAAAWGGRCLARNVCFPEERRHLPLTPSAGAGVRAAGGAPGSGVGDPSLRGPCCGTTPGARIAGLR